VVLLGTVLLALACQVPSSDAAFFGLFGASKSKAFQFREFINGDWKLKRQTLPLHKADGAEAAQPAASAHSDEDDVFGDVDDASAYEDEGVSLLKAFYTLRSDNLTTALVGGYHEEYIGNTKNALKVKIKFDSTTMNSGSFMTGDVGSSEDGEDDEDVLFGGESEKGLSTLFDFRFKQLMEGPFIGSKQGHGVYMSEGPFHGGDSMWYQFIVTHGDRFVIHVLPTNVADMGEGEATSMTITGTKYFGAGAAPEPSFFQKYFPSIMVFGFMILRRWLAPSQQQREQARERRSGGAPQGASSRPGQNSAGVKEMSKED